MHITFVYFPGIACVQQQQCLQDLMHVYKTLHFFFVSVLAHNQCCLETYSYCYYFEVFLSNVALQHVICVSHHENNISHI